MKQFLPEFPENSGNKCTLYSVTLRSLLFLFLPGKKNFCLQDALPKYSPMYRFHSLVFRVLEILLHSSMKHQNNQSAHIFAMCPLTPHARGLPVGSDSPRGRIGCGRRAHGGAGGGRPQSARGRPGSARAPRGHTVVR